MTILDTRKVLERIKRRVRREYVADFASEVVALINVELAAMPRAKKRKATP